MKNITVDEIWTFKLTSGEELVAKVIGVDENELIINNPVSVAPGPNGVGLMPSLFTANSDAPTRLNTNTIAVYAMTDESVKNKYIQATSNIVVPSKKILAG